jgi:hypothetical protein
VGKYVIQKQAGRWENQMSTVSLADLDYLIERAKKITMTPEQVSEQRRSFAYGNTAFENPTITREMVDEEARKIGL